MTLTERKKRTVSSSSDEDSDSFVDGDSLNSTSQNKIKSPARKKRYIDNSSNKSDGNNDNNKSNLTENGNSHQKNNDEEEDEEEENENEKEQQHNEGENNKSNQLSMASPKPIKNTTISSTNPTDKVADNNILDTQALSQHQIKHEEKKPRLVIKKMVLINFKSYAGRQVIGPFHKVKII